MKSFLCIFICFIVFSYLDCHLRRVSSAKSEKAQVEAEAETAYQLQKLSRMVSKLQKQFSEQCRNTTINSTTSTNNNAGGSNSNGQENSNTNSQTNSNSQINNNLNSNQTNSNNNNNINTNSNTNTITNPNSNTNNNIQSNINTQTNTNSQNVINSNSNSQSNTNSQNINNSQNNNKNNLNCNNNGNNQGIESTNQNINSTSTSSGSSSSSNRNNHTCNCKHKMTSAHLFALNNIIAKASGAAGSTILTDFRMQKQAFKKKKLTKFFVEKLLQKLQIDRPIIQKCIKAPLSTFAKILKLTHDIVNGKAGFGQLSVLGEWLCEDLKVIPEKLNDSTIFNDVRNYLNTHIKNE